MRQKKNLFWLMAVLAAITFSVAGISNYILYKKAIAGQRERLEDTVGILAQLIEAVASPDPTFKYHDPEILLRVVLDQIQAPRFRGLGRTGEIVLARQRGDSIVFLTSRRRGIARDIEPITVKSRFGGPIQNALAGKTGTMVGLDYKGDEVLAAFEYISALNLGIVAKIDYSEITAPYIGAAAATGSIAALAMLAGFFLFGRLTNPILSALEASEKQYRTLIETLQEGVWAVDGNANTTFVNSTMADMLGTTPEAMAGKSIYSFMEAKEAEGVKSNLARCQKGVHGQRDIEFIRKNGSRLYAAVEMGPVFNEAGRFTGALAGVMDVSERRLADAALRTSEEKFRSVIEQSADGIVLIASDGAITEWNRGARKITNLRRKDVLGRPPWEIQSGLAVQDKRTPENEEKLKALIMDMLRTQQAHWMNRLIESEIELPDGTHKTIQALVFPIRSQSGAMACGIFRDVTELKKTEEQLKSLLHEKETLLKEVFHRVKNNFQIVSSLLNLQSHTIRNPQVLSVLQESRDRIRTMSLVHEKLYRSESLTGIRFDEYAKELAAGLFDSYGADPFKVSLKIDAEVVSLGMDTAVPCGLIVNELVSNSLKHAFPADWTKNGLISIRLRRERNGWIRLAVADNGRGLPPGMDVKEAQSLGLHLVTMLTEDQLGGKLKIEKRNGTKITIEFKP
jgi:PAS domain S-box-containing protein